MVKFARHFKSGRLSKVFLSLFAVFFIINSVTSSFAYFTSEADVLIKGRLGMWSSPDVLVNFYDENQNFDTSLDQVLMTVSITADPNTVGAGMKYWYKDGEVNGAASYAGPFTFALDDNSLTYDMDVLIIEGRGEIKMNRVPEGVYTYELKYPPGSQYEDIYITTQNHFKTKDNTGSETTSEVKNGLITDDISFDNQDKFLCEVVFDASKDDFVHSEDTGMIKGNVRECIDVEKAAPLDLNDESNTVALEGVKVILYRVEADDSLTEVESATAGVDGDYVFERVEPGEYVVAFEVNEFKTADKPYEFINRLYSVLSDINETELSGQTLIGNVNSVTVAGKDVKTVNAAVKVKNKVTTYYYQDDNDNPEDTVVRYMDFEEIFVKPVYKAMTDAGWENYALDGARSTPRDEREGIVIRGDVEINLYYIYKDPDDYVGKLAIRYIDIDDHYILDDGEYLNDQIDWDDPAHVPAQGDPYIPIPIDDGVDGDGNVIYKYTISQEDLERKELEYSFAGLIEDYSGNQLFLNDVYELYSPNTYTPNIINIYVSRNYGRLEVNHYITGTEERITDRSGGVVSKKPPVGKDLIGVKSAGVMFDASGYREDAMHLHSKWTYNYTDPDDGLVTIVKDTTSIVNFYYDLTQFPVTVELYDVTDSADRDINNDWVLLNSYTESGELASTFTVEKGDYEPYLPNTSKWKFVGEDSDRSIKVDVDKDNIVSLRFVRAADVEVRYLVQGTTNYVTDTSGQSIAPKTFEGLEVGTRYTATNPPEINSRWVFVSADPEDSTITVQDGQNLIRMYYSYRAAGSRDTGGPNFSSDRTGYSPGADYGSPIEDMALSFPGNPAGSANVESDQTLDADRLPEGSADMDRPVPIIDSDSKEPAKMNPKTFATDSNNISIFIAGMVIALFITLLSGWKMRKEKKASDQ